MRTEQRSSVRWKALILIISIKISIKKDAREHTALNLTSQEAHLYSANFRYYVFMEIMSTLVYE